MDKNTINEIVAKLKDLVAKGNVSRVVIRARNGSEILNLSVNAGIIGGVVLLSAAKWLLIIGALTTVGLGCTVEVVKVNNEVTYVVKPEDAEKMKTVTSVIVDEMKGTVDNIVNEVAARTKTPDDKGDELDPIVIEEKDEVEKQ